MENAQILIVEDDLSFAENVKFQLSTSEIKSDNIISVTSIAEVIEVRDFQEPDVILLDLNIEDSSGVETYEKVFNIFPLASVIGLSGMDDESIALEIVSKGGQDYVIKSALNAKILERTIKYGLLRRELTQKVRKSEMKFKDVFNKSPLPISWSAPPASKIVLESILEVTLNAILAGKLAFIIPVITFTEGL